MNGRSRSSMSLVRSFALSASVRATRTVGTSQTSAARRAATSVRMNCARRDQHLAAHVAALLLARELVLEVHAGGARLDHRLHQLEGVERAAEAGLGVGDDRREPVACRSCPSACSIWSARWSALLIRCTTVGTLFDGVEALVRVHLAGGVRVGRDLPAREVDRLQAGAHLCTAWLPVSAPSACDVRLACAAAPRGARAPSVRERVLDLHRAAQPLDVGLGVRADDAVEALRVRGVLVGVR